MVKLGWTAPVVLTLFAAFGLSMIATKQQQSACGVSHGRRILGERCHTTYWFNR